MFKMNANRAQSSGAQSNSGALSRGFSESARRTVLSILAVCLILAAIAANTVLALRQTEEQDSALQALQTSSRLKRDLDQLQQMMLDEHGELYTLISTKPFYTRSAYIFPLRELLELTNDVRDA